jgi:hypothetical protein
VTALLGEPTDSGASGAFSEAEYTKKQIPEPAIFADQLIRDDPGRLVMSDSMPLLDQALWLRPGEPRVVPGVLNGEHAVLFRLGAIVGIVSGVLAAVVIAALLARPAPVNRPEHRHGVMIAYLRSVVLSPGAFYERCHVVFVNEALRLAIVGDVLFCGSIGRTDFPYGDHAALIAAIHEKLLPLGDDMQFICGHGPGSDFGTERRQNPFLTDEA